MMSNLVLDFETSLKNGYVYLVEIETHSNNNNILMNIDFYLVASSWYQAQYIAQTLYPEAIGISVHEQPITEFEYAARRNRSII